MKLGFACVWGKDPKKTWSHTPWNLRQALSHQVNVIDTGVVLTKPTKVLLKVMNPRIQNGRLISNWNPSPALEWVAKSQMRQAITANGVNAVLQIGEIADPGVPFFLYQDFGYDIVLKYRHLGLQTLGFSKVDLAEIERRRDRQYRFYEKASGIFTMSKWFANDLITTAGIDKNRIYVVHAGVNSKPAETGGRSQRQASERKRLLFIGGDFHRKGGDIVLAALAKLRAEVDPSISLTVAGPVKWPLSTEPPAGVDFLGTVPVSQVSALFESHDLLVMPSRFEGFGIVFAEALVHGLPVIGRNAFAMPEIIFPGVNGDLINNDNANELAASIWKTLQNDEIYLNVERERDQTKHYFSWDRIAKDIVLTMSATC